MKEYSWQAMLLFTHSFFSRERKEVFEQVSLPIRLCSVDIRFRVSQVVRKWSGSQESVSVQMKKQGRMTHYYEPSNNLLHRKTKYNHFPCFRRTRRKETGTLVALTFIVCASKCPSGRIPTSNKSQGA